MSGDGVDALVDALHDELGGSLRVVAEYTRDGYDVHHAREDVRERVATLADGVHTDLVLQGVGRDRLEELFGDDLTCSMHRFEETTAFHFVGDGSDYEGLFVSVDSDADVPLATFTDVCRGRR